MLSKDSELLNINYQGLAEIFGFKTGNPSLKAFYAKTVRISFQIIKRTKKIEKMHVIYK